MHRVFSKGTLAARQARSGKEAVELMAADLSLQAEVHRLVKGFEARYDGLDVLVNSVGDCTQGGGRL